ncbi:MAG: SDR family oxidoreductase [Beijerinckiaceae bacterium]|jgi:NAD(P)-dependent dehydrogenase (short-subunit alcohol dehydrogenase family)|nr:SDR family oxidoreductase [Beijerinckiaceae bacterium]
MAPPARTCLITGANRGIGLELARQSAAAGAKVIATCRDPANAEALQELAKKPGSTLEIYRLDVGLAESVGALSRQLGDTPIDMLINNAGIMGADPQTSLTMDFDTMGDVLNVNLIGALRVTQAFMTNVEAAKGKIAVISSMMAQYDFTGTSKLAYCVSKTAATRAFNMLAGDIRSKGVTICILSPGWVKTDMGGVGAPVTAETSARGLLQQIDKWALKDSGDFRNFEGRELAW